jgi:hypothetical protein
MYGMGGMAKDALKNSFVGKVGSSSNTKIKDSRTQLGHIEKRSASRALTVANNTPSSYKPARIRQSERTSNIFKGAQFTGCTYLNGTITKTTLNNCTIIGGDIDIDDIETTNLKVTGLATINQLKVTRVASELIPSLTCTYDLGSSTLPWKDIYLCNALYFKSSYLKMEHTGSHSLITSTVGNFTIDNTSTTGEIILQLGADTTATNFQVKDNTGNIKLQVAGSGQVDITNNLDVSGGINIDADNQALTIGTGGDISITHTGSHSSLTSATGNFTIDNTAATGATIMQLGTDTSATDFQVKNNTGTTLFEVNGAGDSTVTGSLTIDNIKINGSNIGLASTDEDLMTLTDGVLTVAGDVSANRFLMTSDRRLKKSIKELDKEEIENNFEKLESVKFKWRKQANPHTHNTGYSKKEHYNYGLIAQNVLECFPDCAYEKPDGYLGVDYSGLTSVLISKVQTQNEELKDSRGKNDKLEATVKKQSIILDNLISRMEKMEKDFEFQNSMEKRKSF